MSRQRVPLLATWVLVVAVGAFTYCQLRHQPLYYDAQGYVNAARSMRDGGVLSRWLTSDRRTYGYPLFLLGAFRIADWLRVGLVSGVFALQWPIFVGSAWLASRSLFASERGRLTAFLLVAANPLLVVNTANALTESLSLSCVLIAVTALGGAASSTRRSASTIWLITGAAASSFSVAIRPGNVLIPGCYAIGAAWILLRTADQSTRRRSVIAALVAAALIGPLVPQVLINQRNYDRVTPLPVFDLTALQTRYGLQLIRYATNVSTECGAPQVMFLNPDEPRLDMSTTEALRYYAFSWPEGPEAAALHIFSAVDPRPFLTYQHDFGADYERWLQAFTVAIIFLAGVGLPTAVRKLRGAERLQKAGAAFLVLVTILSLAITATSAAEYRFGVIPLTTLSLLAAFGTTRIRRPSWRVVCLGAAGYFSVLLLWMTLSDLVLATSENWRLCS